MVSQNTPSAVIQFQRRASKPIPNICIFPIILLHAVTKEVKSKKVKKRKRTPNEPPWSERGYAKGWAVYMYMGGE